MTITATQRPSLGLLGVLGILLVAAEAAGAADLAPAKGFRVRLEPAAIGAGADVEGARKLAGLTADGRGAWPPEGATGQVALDLAVPAEAAKGGVLVALDIERLANGETVVALEAGSSGRSLERVSAEEMAEPGRRWVRLAAPKGRKALRIVLGAGAGAPGAEPGRATPRLHAVKLYRLDPRGRNDYWLFLGASLTVGGIKADDFERAVAARFPGFEPHVASEAVSGQTSTGLARTVAGVLARHPHARFVAVETGGNDISAQRPYPGGAEKLEANLVVVLDAIVAAGKIPILARQSYRAYGAKDGKPAVPPEENGSLPYVERVIDPLIARYSPAFFDRRAGRGVVDLYTYYKEHPQEIGGDGVHLTATGYKSWARIWLESAGPIIYGDD